MGFVLGPSLVRWPAIDRLAGLEAGLVDGGRAAHCIMSEKDEHKLRVPPSNQPGQLCDRTVKGRGRKPGSEAEEHGRIVASIECGVREHSINVPVCASRRR